ncbi:creatininase family protein [Streptomyces liangshanensis]|uniref:Creatininase family protein n=1 Tax=Streptomyces liangshanensis TaxID=2717324 RepID=A0A6G9GZK6_9ACTN|nr:creatininase family protein [Streptomyces liangshanensis]QIQ03675.1 creatininase family protein [Streptomyces liangshanensis]
MSGPAVPPPASGLLPGDTTEDVGERRPRVAVLPIGSFEQHGAYLPLVTDTVVACAVASEIAAVHPVLHLPPLTISCSHEHADWPGTVSISAATLYAVVADIAASLRRSGIHGLILVNGHGGNYVLRNVVQESAGSGTRMALFPGSSDWDAARERAGVRTPSYSDMHAGEVEASILLHARPELVRSGYETSDFVADERKHLLTLGMRSYTDSGVVGRPSLASAEKGKELLAGLVDCFAEYLALVTADGGVGGVGGSVSGGSLRADSAPGSSASGDSASGGAADLAAGATS